MGGVQQPALAERGAGQLDRPDGIEIAGIPASDIGTVQKSLRYMASGSSVLAPSSNAVHGLVGVTTKSNAEKTAAKSSAILVRTFCAVP